MNKELLDNLVRDLTKVGSISKSEARRRIEEYIEENDKNWKIAIWYNCDDETIDRIFKAKEALTK